MLLIHARASLACSVLALVACGGAQKPADSVDTASLESTSSPSGESKPSSSSRESAEPSAAAATTTPAAASSAGAASSPDTAAPAAIHPVPGSTGSIDGKPFSPKLAQIAGPVQKDGRVTLVLHERSDCVAPGDVKPGDASMVLVVPWQDGYKTDLSSLRRAKKGGSMGEAAFVRVGDDGKKQVSTTFKPTGLVTVVSAPTKKDAVGKVKIDLQTGDYMVTGDLDVKVCSTAK